MHVNSRQKCNRLNYQHFIRNGDSLLKPVVVTFLFSQKKVTKEKSWLNPVPGKVVLLLLV